MKARRLIESSDFPPEALHVMFQAFDKAWSEVSHHFAADESEKERARTRLAHAILAVAGADSRDAERLKNEALQVMAMGYRDRTQTDKD
jgi:hypothetical protein